MYICISWVTLLYNENWHNIVNQLYLDKEMLRNNRDLKSWKLIKDDLSALRMHNFHYLFLFKTMICLMRKPNSLEKLRLKSNGENKYDLGAMMQ